MRIRERIARAAKQRVTLLVAPAGYGKSVALDAYLRDCGAEALRFDVRRSHASLARFARALAAAFEPALPAMGQSLAIAHERAAQSPRPSDVLATWLAEHLDGTSRTIFIDDFHHCEGERGISALIAGAIARTGPYVRWVIAARSTEDFPLATWLAGGHATLPIDADALRLTIDEALAIGRAVAPGVDAALVARLCEQTAGTPAAFAFALETLARDPEGAGELIAGSGPVFDRFAQHVFAGLTPVERARLVEAATLPELDGALVAHSADGAAWLEAIEARAPQLFVASGGRRHFHGLFLPWMQARLADRGCDAVRAATLRAANALERVGRIDEALEFYLRERHHAGLVRLIEAHGFAFFDGGRGESIREAIDALDPLLQLSSPVVLAIKAIWESKGGRFDTAESWFQLALDRAPHAQRAQIAYQYGTHLLRFFRPEAVEVLERLASDVAVTGELRAYSLAALGPAYVVERRIDDARRVTDEGLALATGIGTKHLVAKCHFQAAYVALYAGDAARAKHLASIALSLSNEFGFFDIAAGALSVLYNVASDIEDDPVESLRLLEAVADCAAKSGSLTNQLIALVASLEIEVERNNERVAERIDAELQTLDVSLAGRATYEALLPTQAMRASWTADFVGAYRLLEHSADRHWSADRRALRFAEIAAYAAAAGFEREATDAMAAASEILATMTTIDLRVQRARLMFAFAAIVLGRGETAAEILATVGASPHPLSRRLQALRDTLDALSDRYRGSRNHERLLARLRELADVGFAGLARTISMLPLHEAALKVAG